MTREAVKKRIAALDPWVVDTAIALGLALFVCLQIYLVTRAPLPPAGMGVPERGPGAGAFIRDFRRDHGVWPYLVAVSAFLPLAIRRKIPWLALVFSGGAALFYATQHWPPAFTTLGPMIALYTQASLVRSRHTGLLAWLIIGLAAAVAALAFSPDARWIIESAGTFALLAAAALMGDTARNRREYIAEVEQRALEAERTREEEALRRVDEERIRIAREVHDIVAHSLSIVTVQAGAAAAVLEKNPSLARESIENIRATGKHALTELRSVIDVLRTGDGTAPRAPAADLSGVEQLVAPVRDAGIAVSVDITGDLAVVPAFASVSAYRIVQESLTNVVRHAKASSVIVSLTVRERELSIAVTDDGAGTATESLATATGHGLRGMHERVEALGGTFEAGPRPGGGFSVSAHIPLPRR
jgi:signal transduction histidine kinase